LERAQCRALKKIQGLPIRTHDVIVRGMVQQHSIETIMDQKKLMFLLKLIEMENCIHKQLFLTRVYEYILGRHTQGFIPDVWTIANKYRLNHYIMEYITGGSFPNKTQWRNIVKERLHEFSQEHRIQHIDSQKYNDIISRTGGGSILYRVAKRHPMYSKALIAMGRLITLPSSPGICTLCGKDYADVVNHVVNCCTYVNIERNELWDTMTNQLDVTSSVELFNMDDELITCILLGQKWRRLRCMETRDNFYCSISKHFIIFVRTVSQIIPWFHQ